MTKKPIAAGNPFSLGSLALFCAALALSACSEDSKGGAQCDTGSLRCACYKNQTCDEGLSCYSDVCVAEGGAAGAGNSAAGNTGEAGSRSGEGGSGGERDGTAGSSGNDPGSAGSGMTEAGGRATTGGATNSAGSTSAGGATNSAGSTSAGGTTNSAGNTSAGGTTSAGGNTAAAVGGATAAAGADSVGGQAGSMAAGGSPSAGGSAGAPSMGGGAGTDPGVSGIIPDDGGSFIKDWNQTGVLGPWYLYDDTYSVIESDYSDPSGLSDIGSSGGELCFTGTTEGHYDVDYELVWGAGAGFDVCHFPEDMSFLPAELQSAASADEMFFAADCPTEFQGVLSISFSITGSWVIPLRVNFKENDIDAAPFYSINSSGSYTIDATDARVPTSWDVPNAGQRGSSNIVSIQFQAPSDTYAQSFDFCLSDIVITVG